MDQTWNFAGNIPDFTFWIWEAFKELLCVWVPRVGEKAIRWGILHVLASI